MRKVITTVFLTAALVSVGCDVDINKKGTTPVVTPTAPATGTDGVNVDVGDTPAEDRMERREERRENFRKAVDGVDVQVGDGGVKVDVDGE